MSGDFVYFIRKLLDMLVLLILSTLVSKSASLFRSSRPDPESRLSKDALFDTLSSMPRHQTHIRVDNTSFSNGILRAEKPFRKKSCAAVRERRAPKSARRTVKCSASQRFRVYRSIKSIFQDAPGLCGICGLCCSGHSRTNNHNHRSYHHFDP